MENKTDSVMQNKPTTESDTATSNNNENEQQDIASYGDRFYEYLAQESKFYPRSWGEY